MSDIVSINLQIADVTVPQRNFSNPLILGLFDYDDNITGPLASGVYFTDNGLVSGNQVRVKKYETLTEVAEDFRTTSEEYKMAAVIFGQTITPEYILIGQERSGDTTKSAALNAIIAEMDDFYIILNSDTSASDSELANISNWAEANKKFFIIQSNDADIYGSGSSALLTAIGPEIHRTEVIYNQVVNTYADAALAGFWGSLEPGTETQKFLKLSTLTAVNDESLGLAKVNDTKKTNILAKYVNIYYNGVGGRFFQEGTAVSGRFADITRYSDKLKYNLESEISLTFLNPPVGNKIPYTDGGVNQIVTAIRKVLDNELAAGKITPFEAVDSDGMTIYVPYKIKVVPVSDVATNDKNSRQYNDITIEVRYSSAIHKAGITGKINV
jgi:hypothetical protein